MTNTQSIEATPDNLNDLMSFGHVIRVHEDGTVTEPRNVPANEVIDLVLDADGQSLDDDYEDVYSGWAPFTAGYTSQHGYSGPTMHAGESIGGRLAYDILNTPGDYVAVIVDGIPAEGESDDSDLAIGWAVLRRDS